MRGFRLNRLSALFILCLLPAHSIFGQNNVKGEWTGVIPMPIVAVAAANLPDGKVLTWSAYGRFAFGGNRGKTYTAIFDPATNQSQEMLIENTQHDMFCPGINNLADGRILVAGGSSSNRTSIYNPFTDAWTDGGDMNIPRGYQGNVTLSDGSAFTIGGSWSGGRGNKHAEIWTEENGWTTLPGVPVAPILDGVNDPQGVYREDNHAWLWPAPNGKLFHAGPSANMHWIDTENGGSYTDAGPRGSDGYSMCGTTVMFDIGKILKTGGANRYSQGVVANNNNRCYVIDINTDNAIVTDVPNMEYTRVFHNSIVLPNGNVIVFGGNDKPVPFSDTGYQTRNTPEMYDPVANTWTKMDPMVTPRNYHSIGILLNDGRIMLAGGGLCGNCATNHADAEIFSPPYLFQANGQLATRPVINQAPAEAGYGSQINVQTNSAISSFVLIRSSSATHSTNNEQRRIPLTFTSNGSNNYTVDIANSSLLPPGYYMLFAMNNAGVPSVAKMVRVGETSYSAPGVEIPSGVRFSFTARHSEKVINVNGNSKAENGILNQWTDLGVARQLFEVIPLGNNQYRIKATNSGRYLATLNGATANATKVVQQAWTNGAHQKWEFEQNADGYSLIKHVKSGKYLDISGRSMGNGGALIIWPKHGRTNQQFMMTEVLPQTEFVIEARHSGKVMNVTDSSQAQDGNVVQYAHAGGANNEVWFLDYQGKGQYRIKATHSNKYLAAKDGATVRGTSVVQQTWTNGAHQKWTLIKSTGGYYHIQNVKAGMNIDVFGNRQTNNANMIIWTNHFKANQQFRFVPAFQGSYILKARHSGKSAHVQGISQAHNANVLQYTVTAGDNNKWVIDYIGLGQFRLKAQHSNKYLAVLGGSTVNGASVVQQTWAGEAHQKWYIEANGEGYYTIRNVNSGKVLNVFGRSNANNANIIIWPQNGISENEQWELTPVDGTNLFRESGPAIAEYLTFDALPEVGQVKLEWKLKHEEAIESYRIERSIDRQTFEVIDAIEASDEEGLAPAYEALDMTPIMGQSYYRISGLGYNGEIITSEVRAVKFKDALHEVVIYPNPVSEGHALVVELRQSVPGTARVELVSVMGKTLAMAHYGSSYTRDMVQFDVSGFPAGRYFVKVTAADWQEVETVVIK